MRGLGVCLLQEEGKASLVNTVFFTVLRIMAAESVLEHQRKLHEERERLEDALVKEKSLKKPTVSKLIMELVLQLMHTTSCCR